MYNNFESCQTNWMQHLGLQQKKKKIDQTDDRTEYDIRECYGSHCRIEWLMAFSSDFSLEFCIQMEMENVNRSTTKNVLHNILVSELHFETFIILKITGNGRSEEK